MVNDDRQREKKYLPLPSNEKEEIESLNIGQYNKEIDEAMARIDNSEYTAHEDLEKEMASW